MNKTTQRYFINLFKRKKRIIALYTFICFMAYPFLLLANTVTGDTKLIGQTTMISFVLALIVLAILAIVLPIFTFKFVFVKKHVDTYFSMPINRRHMFKAHFIAPILGAILPILVNYLIGGLFLIPIQGISVFFELLVVLLLAFVIFIVIYSVNTFFILHCNSVIDASLISAAIGIVPFMLYLALDSFLYSQMMGNTMDALNISELANVVIKILSPYNGLVLIGRIVDTSMFHIRVNFDQFDVMLFVYYVVIGIVFMIQAQIAFKNKKGEDAEQLSTHFLTYPLFTNVGIFSLILWCNLMSFSDFTAAIIVLVILFVVYTIIHGIANRSMKVTMKMIVKFVVLVVVVNGFNYISKETEFFGMNRKVIDYTKYEQISIVYDEYYYGESFDEDYVELKATIDVDNMSKEELELINYFEEIQRVKSLAFKENDYENKYPSTSFGNASVSIQYMESLKSYGNIAKYVHYELNDEQCAHIKQYMEKIDK